MEIQRRNPENSWFRKQVAEKGKRFTDFVASKFESDSTLPIEISNEVTEQDIEEASERAKNLAELGDRPWGELGPNKEQLKIEEQEKAMIALGTGAAAKASWEITKWGSHRMKQTTLRSISWMQKITYKYYPKFLKKSIDKRSWLKWLKPYEVPKEATPIRDWLGKITSDKLPVKSNSQPRKK